MENENIEIGTYATGSYYSDCYPFEVIEKTASGKTITIRELDAEKTEGYDYFSNQAYTFTSNPKNRTMKVRLTKRGWRTKCNMKVYFGNARKYQDPHF